MSRHATPPTRSQTMSGSMPEISRDHGVHRDSLRGGELAGSTPVFPTSLSLEHARFRSCEAQVEEMCLYSLRSLPPAPGVCVTPLPRRWVVRRIIAQPEPRLFFRNAHMAQGAPLDIVRHARHL